MSSVLASRCQRATKVEYTISREMTKGVHLLHVHFMGKMAAAAAAAAAAAVAAAAAAAAAYVVIHGRHDIPHQIASSSSALAIRTNKSRFAASATLTCSANRETSSPCSVNSLGAPADTSPPFRINC